MKLIQIILYVFLMCDQITKIFNSKFPNKNNLNRSDNFIEIQTSQPKELPETDDFFSNSNNSIIKPEKQENENIITNQIFYDSFLDEINQINKEFSNFIEKTENLYSTLNDDKNHKSNENKVLNKENKEENTNLKSDDKKIIKKLKDEVNYSIKNIESHHKNFLENFNEFETVSIDLNKENIKKKFEKNLLFYNSISLIMLALLAGGLVGIIFILYFSFGSGSENNLNNKDIIK
jgi:hypothetical protein